MALMSGRGGRKILRCIHLAVNGSWLGAVLSCLLLVAAGSPDDPAPFLAAFWLHDHVVAWLACVVLFTGLLFSFFTPWGLVKSWWIVGKWAGLAALGLGIPFVVTPVVNALAARSDLALTLGAAGGDLEVVESRTLLLLGAEALLLVVLFALSTWKPRGETGLRWEERRWVRRGLLTLAVATVALAVFASASLERTRRTPLTVTTASGLPDGAYDAAIDWLGAPVAVRVGVQHGRIERLQILQAPTGHYPDLGALVVAKVEAAGRLDVDGITGATTSARSVLVAAAKALGRP